MMTVAEQCARSIVETIQGLGIEGVDADEIALRDMAEDSYAPRGISVIPMVESEGSGTNAKDDYGYRFMVVMSRGSGKAWAEHTTLLQDWRNAVRKAFNNKRLLDVPQVHICGVSNGDYLQPKKWQENRTASVLVVTCWARETRT